jgi:hypothetical protein
VSTVEQVDAGFIDRGAPQADARTHRKAHSQSVLVSSSRAQGTAVASSPVSS